MPFDGATYEPAKDRKRLMSQLEAVRDVMSAGTWCTISGITGLLQMQYRLLASEAGVSARIRDLRKAKFGACSIERMRRGGLFYYRMVPRAKDDA